MSQASIHDRPTQIKAQIERIESIMVTIELYSDRRPDDSAFESSAPFCYDTMSFLEWLQWVMFPKTCELIEKQLPLPTVCEIHPLAEEEFKQLELKADALLAEIAVLDRLFSVAH